MPTTTSGVIVHDKMESKAFLEKYIKNIPEDWNRGKEIYYQARQIIHSFLALT